MACERIEPAAFSSASHHGNATQPCHTEQTFLGSVTVCSPFATECTNGQFLDGGQCYSCPNGYDRTVFPIGQSNACDRPA